LLIFASTVILGFSLLKIRDKDLYFLLDMNVFGNGASLFDDGGFKLSM
jgi:hypothetical protein